MSLNASHLSRIPFHGPDAPSRHGNGTDRDDGIDPIEPTFRHFAESLSDLVWSARPDGFSDYYNRRFLDYLGRTLGEMQGWTWAGMVHPDDTESARGAWAEASTSGGEYEVEFRLRRHDGVYRWHRSHGTPLRDGDGRIRRWFGTCTDIEERKRAEERLRLLGEAAAVLLSSDEPDAMMRGLFARLAPHFKLDSYFNFMVNEAGDALRLESCIGIPEETARTITRLEFGQAVCGTVAQLRRPIVATEIQQSDDPKVQLVKSFGIRSYACNPLLSGDRLLGTLSFASRTRDRFDAAELEFFATVCRYVTSAYDRLALIGQLREADRRKDEFLATLAHELRNPLAPIRNVLHLMSQPDGGLMEEERAMAERQVAHLARLVDDLMDVARISKGKIELRTEQVALDAVVAHAVESARAAIEGRRQRLDVALPGEPIRLEADPTRLEQVLGNLLSNACKYSDPGGRILLSAARRGAEVEIRVADTGIGIAAEKLPHIFEMFAQVDHRSARAEGGLGIGLGLVRSLVEMHGGTIEARSAGPGKGSAFLIRLPALPAGCAEIKRVSSDAPGSALPRRRVLVVDDNIDAATSLSRVLSRLYAQDVRVVHDGPSALKAASEFRPDLILLDIGMPGMDGHEVARRLKERPELQRTLIVALTGWGQESDRKRSEQAGFDRHLVKPVAPDVLRDLLAGLGPSPTESTAQDSGPDAVGAR